MFKLAINADHHPYPMIKLAKIYYQFGMDSEADSLVFISWPKADKEVKTEMLQFLVERAEHRRNYKTAPHFYKQTRFLIDSI